MFRLKLTPFTALLFISLLLSTEAFPQNGSDTAAAAVAPDTLGIAQVISMALDNNPDIIISRSQAELTRNAATAGNAGLYPSLSSRASYSASNSGGSLLSAGSADALDYSGSSSSSASASLSSSMVLYSGGRLKSSYEKLRENARLGSLLSEQQIDNIIVRVINAYYNVALLEENFRLSLESYEISRQRYLRIQNRALIGSSGSLQLLSAEVDMNADSLALLQADLQLANAKRDMNYLVGRGISSPVEVETGIRCERLLKKDLIFGGMMKQNPSLIAAQLNLQIAGLDETLARSSYLPTLAGNASYAYARTDNETGSILESSSGTMTAGLSLSWDLYLGGSRSVALQNARIRTRIQEETLKKTETGLQNSYSNAWAVYENALLSVRLNEKTLVTARRNFERTSELYELGQVSTTQFREAQLNLLSAEYRLISSRYSSKLSELELLRLSGALLEHLQAGDDSPYCQ